MKNLGGYILTVVIVLATALSIFTYADVMHENAYNEEIENLKEYWDYDYDEEGNLVFYDQHDMVKYTFKETDGSDWELMRLRDLVDKADWQSKYLN